MLSKNEGGKLMNSALANVPELPFDILMSKDVWHANELGLSLSEDSSSYWLSFKKIKPCWLKTSAKLFVYYQSQTKSFNTCCQYIKSLLSFGTFIVGGNVNINSQGINRKLIVDYIHYLTTVKQFKPTTRNGYLSGLRCFLDANMQEKWLAFSSTAVIYNNDYSKVTKSLPKFIPELVIQKLLENIEKLSEQNERIIRLFLETGRRRGELFTLPYDCLEHDSEGDYFLKIKDRKMCKAYMIPITLECADLIRKQQRYVDKLTSDKEFLFVRTYKGKIQPVKSRCIHTLLNDLAKKNNIVDWKGKLWHFHFHQFRHTVATKMINGGVPHHMVQRFLGHESPEMTARYTNIHDATLKNEFNKFQKNFLISKNEDIDVDSVLDQDALIEYKHHLEITKQLVRMAELKGWTKQREMNLSKQRELEAVINKIESVLQNEN